MGFINGGVVSTGGEAALKELLKPIFWGTEPELAGIGEEGIPGYKAMATDSAWNNKTYKEGAGGIIKKLCAQFIIADTVKQDCYLEAICDDVVKNLVAAAPTLLSGANIDGSNELTTAGIAALNDWLKVWNEGEVKEKSEGDPIWKIPGGTINFCDKKNYCRSKNLEERLCSQFFIEDSAKGEIFYEELVKCLSAALQENNLLTEWAFGNCRKCSFKK